MLADKQNAANYAAHLEMLPIVQQWAEGVGDTSKVRRFGRRQELQILGMAHEAMRLKVSPFQWTQMMTSGLEKREV